MDPREFVKVFRTCILANNRVDWRSKYRLEFKQGCCMISISPFQALNYRLVIKAKLRQRNEGRVISGYACVEGKRRCLLNCRKGTYSMSAFNYYPAMDCDIQRKGTQPPRSGRPLQNARAESLLIEKALPAEA